MTTTMKRPPRRMAAFTLIELLVAVAVVAIILALAGPAFGDYLRVQRLRAVHDLLITDLNYARSEAVSRGTFVQARFQTGTGMSCYILYSRTDNTDTAPCDCTAPAGSRCTAAPGNTAEIKTVIAPASERISFDAPVPLFTIDPRTGGTLLLIVAEGATPTSFLVATRLDGGARSLQAEVALSGRVWQCVPAGSPLQGPACT